MKHKRSVMGIAMATIMLVSLCAVCASTSVSTAQGSSKPSVQATPSLVGAPIAAGTGPSACVLNGTDSMFVFVKGYDGALWYKIWNTSTLNWQGGWVSLGGKLTSSPAAVSRLDGVLDVYVAGTNGQVYENYYNAAGWHTWGSIGGKVAPGTGPGASAWTGRDDVFVQGTNGAMYQKTWNDSSGWGNWVNLGGQLTSSPAAAAFTYHGVVDMVVFVRGTDGAVYVIEFWGGSWSNWYNLGGQVAPGTGPATCAYNWSRFDVFVEGTNGALYQKTFNAASQWSGWTNLWGQLTSSPAASAFTSQGTIAMSVFVRGTNGLTYCTPYVGGAWHGWFGPYQGPP